jgi:hypothetical protein
MLRISLISGLILDGILLACMAVSVVVSNIRNREVPGPKLPATAVIATRVALLAKVVFYGLAGALATYFALRCSGLSL